MPSPFPGMDPYLEDPRYWEGFHSRLIVALDAQLNHLLPDDYASNVEERIYVQEERQHFRPDAAILYSPRELDTRSGSGGGVAVAEVAENAPHQIRLLDSGPIRERYIEIVTVRGGERVVAVIELLSPANKAPGRGREEYLRKQRALLESDTHLLEIDLLRGGEHTVAPPAEALRQETPDWDYVIVLHNAHDPDAFAYWPLRLPDPLPRVRLPLARNDSLVLDLSQALRRAYDDGPYRRQVEYNKPPALPLNPEDAAWTETVLAEKGYSH